MAKRIIESTFSIIAMLFLFIGCTRLSTQSESAVTPSPTPNSGLAEVQQSYPNPPRELPTINYDSSYPAQKNTPYKPFYPDQITIPKSSTNEGIVIGRFVGRQDHTTPYMAPTIFLGKAIESNLADYPPIISLDVDNDPKAIQDNKGNFVFEKIEPGTYGLVIWSPFSQTLIQDPKMEGFPFILYVKSGEVLDLGTIEVP